MTPYRLHLWHNNLSQFNFNVTDLGISKYHLNNSSPYEVKAENVIVFLLYLCKVHHRDIIA